jgi:hypothetical protein
MRRRDTARRRGFDRGTHCTDLYWPTRDVLSFLLVWALPNASSTGDASRSSDSTAMLPPPALLSVEPSRLSAPTDDAPPTRASANPLGKLMPTALHGESGGGGSAGRVRSPRSSPAT